jgi:Zn-dependent protease with chaperone function
LLSALDRDETQAVVGDLVASAGNGDLRIGVTITSLFQTLGVVAAFLNAPWDRSSRRNLWRLARLSMRPRRRTPAEIAAMGDLFAAAEPGWADEPNKKTGCLSVITLPFLMAGGAFMMNRLIFGLLLVNPLLRRRWRARRYLADASAVELTRNPSALASALRVLDRDGGVPAGAEWASHLFVVGPPSHASGQPTPRREPPEVTTFVAPVGTRIARLVQMGADPEPQPAPAGPVAPRSGCATIALVVIVGPLLAFVALVLLACALVLTGISLAIDMMFLGPAVALIHNVLRDHAR